MSGLLVAGLWREGKPYEIPGVRHMWWFYHASLPRAGPVSTSSCSVSGDIRANISSRSWASFRITNRSQRGTISILDPSRTPHCSATGFGMRKRLGVKRRRGGRSQGS